jgi:hypothetical protein
VQFTRFIYGMIVPPQSQVTFSYRFYPEANIEPRDYALMAAFDYEDEEGVQYTNTYHNGTVVMFEANSGFDFSGFVPLFHYFSTSKLCSHFCLFL